MPKNSSTVFLHKGMWSLIILSLLKREDMYSRELVNNVAKYSGGIITANYNTIYPVLLKMADQGLVSCRRVRTGKRMEIVYYHIEPAGEERLSVLLEEYSKITEGVFQILRCKIP